MSIHNTASDERHDPALSDLPTPKSRTERRKARTRAALVGAGRTMLGDGRASSASIQDITDEADVGFGTFYNHFTDKRDLFQEALEQVLEEWGQHLDRMSAEIADPAEVFIACVRTTGRLGRTHPDVARTIGSAGFAIFDVPTGLAPRSIRDLVRCVEAKRFQLDNPVAAFATTAGSLMALLHLWLKDENSIGDKDIDDVAEQLLRMFGLSPEEAHELAHKPLPDHPLLPT